jgi:hypothetical protein
MNAVEVFQQSRDMAEASKRRRRSERDFYRKQLDEVIFPALQPLVGRLQRVTDDRCLRWTQYNDVSYCLVSANPYQEYVDLRITADGYRWSPADGPWESSTDPSTVIRSIAHMLGQRLELEYQEQ